MIRDSGLFTFDELSEAYYEQARGLTDGELICFLLKQFWYAQCQAALFAIEKLFNKTGKRIPVMVSGTITDASGKNIIRQTVEAFCFSVLHIGFTRVLGFNCALGAKQLRPHISSISRKSELLSKCSSKCRASKMNSENMMKHLNQQPHR